MSAPPDPARGLPGRLLLAALAGALALGLVEGAAALWGAWVVDPKVIVLGDAYWDAGHVLDADLFWRPAPGARARDAWPGVDVEINALGTRGREVPAVPGPGVRRVVAIGESTTFGHGVRAEEAYPAVLEAILDRERPEWDVEVLNAGVRAWTVWQGMRFVEERLASLRPSLLLVYFEANDGMPTAIRNGEEIRRWMPYTDREMDLLLHGFPLPPSPPGERLLRVLAQRTSVGRLVLRGRSPDTLVRVPLADRREAWDRLLRAAAAIPVPVVILHPLYRWGAVPHPCLLRDLASSRGLPLVDLEREAHASGFDPERDFLDSAHPTAPLHARFARAIADALERHGPWPVPAAASP